METKIDALKNIGANARKIATEIGGNYVIAVSTETPKKKKNLCVYRSSKRLGLIPGAIHHRILVKAFPYSSEEEYVSAYKTALKFIAKLEGKS